VLLLIIPKIIIISFLIKSYYIDMALEESILSQKHLKQTPAKKISDRCCKPTTCHAWCNTAIKNLLNL
jgi:hypothetical protein